MARNNKDDDLRKKKSRPSSSTDKRNEEKRKQDEEETNQKDSEPEHVRQQNQVGNAALAAFQNNAGAAGSRGAGVDVEMIKRKMDQQKAGEEYGGEDDPGDPNAALEWEAEESWNAWTTAPTDHAEFLEAMENGDLPDEDEAWMAAIPDAKVPPLETIDAWLQPSVPALAIHPNGWCRGAIRLSGTSLAERTLAMLVRRPGPLLQDANARMLPVRARVAALADLLAMASPAGAMIDENGATFVRFLLEAEARDVRVRLARIALGEEKKPSAVTLFDALLNDIHPGVPASGRADPAVLPEGASYAVDDVIRTLLALDDPRSLVPRLVEPAETNADADDPLGLDAVIAGSEAAADSKAVVYKTALQGAERLASVLHLTRVRAAGVANVLVETLADFDVAPPEESLRDVMGAVDAETHEIMQSLKEIARSSQRMDVPLATLAVALGRAANGIVDLHLRLRGSLGGLAVVGLVDPPDLPQRSSPPVVDPLSEAWADGVPARALAWLAELPPSPDRNAAMVFTQLAFDPNPLACLPGLEALRAEGGPLGLAAGVAMGACLLTAGRPDEALALAAAQAETALERGNGVVLADAILLSCDILHTQNHKRKLQKIRKEAGGQLWVLGAWGPLSLLARWEPPDAHAEEDDAWVPPAPPAAPA